MTRLVSCYSNCFGPDGVYAAVERVPSTGLRHLELALRGHDFGGLVIPETAVLTERAHDDEARAFLGHLTRHGVTISGCNVGGANILTEEGVELTIRRIRFAKRWFGVAVVVSGAGQPTGDSEYLTVVSNLRKIGDAAEELGMTVALETHKGPTQNADAMIYLMRSVDHPRIRINFDTGNIAYYNTGMNPGDELEKVKHLVQNVHLKDNRGGFAEWYFPALGQGGAVDFERIREILDGEDSISTYTIEIEGIGNEAEPGLDARAERVKQSVDHLRACGYFE